MIANAPSTVFPAAGSLIIPSAIDPGDKPSRPGVGAGLEGAPRPGCPFGVGAS